MTRSPAGMSKLPKFTLSVLLSLLAAAVALPFVWMVLTSLKPAAQADSGRWLPASVEISRVRVPLPERAGGGFEAPVPANYWQVFKESKFAGYFVNSLFVASWVTFLQLVTSAMGAYAFSRIPWKGRDAVFLLYLATLILPGVVLVVPLYQAMAWAQQVWGGWLDGYKCLIVPAAFSAFGTFLLRQYMLTLPRALDEAAEIDGASRWRIFWDVILPLSKPGLAALAVFSFLGNYASFVWPLFTMRTDGKLTLPVGLLRFEGLHARSTHLVMAAGVMYVVPVLVLFLLFQRYLVRGARLAAVKGHLQG